MQIKRFHTKRHWLSSEFYTDYDKMATDLQNYRYYSDNTEDKLTVGFGNITKERTPFVIVHCLTDTQVVAIDARGKLFIFYLSDEKYAEVLDLESVPTCVVSVPGTCKILVSLSDATVRLVCLEKCVVLRSGYGFQGNINEITAHAQSQIAIAYSQDNTVSTIFDLSNFEKKIIPAMKAAAIPATGIPQRKYRRQIGFFGSASLVWDISRLRLS